MGRSESRDLRSMFIDLDEPWPKIVGNNRGLVIWTNLNRRLVTVPVGNPSCAGHSRDRERRARVDSWYVILDNS